MKLKLRTLFAGPVGCYQPGTVVEFSPEVAEQLLAGGYADRVDGAGAPVVETAEAPTAPEIATAPAARRVRKS